MKYFAYVLSLLIVPVVLAGPKVKDPVCIGTLQSLPQVELCAEFYSAPDVRRSDHPIYHRFFLLHCSKDNEDKIYYFESSTEFNRNFGLQSLSPKDSVWLIQVKESWRVFNFFFDHKPGEKDIEEFIDPVLSK